MGEPNYINIDIQTEGVIPVATRAVGKVAIIGYSDTITNGVAREHSSVSDINATYGPTSALSRSASLAIQNGANPVVCVPVDATITTYMGAAAETFSAEATEVILTDIPQLGSVVVAEGTIAAPTKTFVEGPSPAAHDYIILVADTGSSKIIFHPDKEPDNSGVVEYLVMQESDLTTGLGNLESVDCNFVLIAYATGNTTLLSGSTSSLETHIISASTGAKPRLGVAANAKDVTTLTLSALIINDRMVLFHHKSYYDIAAIVAGVMSTFKPQESMVLKAIQSDVSTGNFTDANYATFKTNQINAIVKHSKIPTPAYRITESFTLSTGTFKKYIDTMRVIDDSSFKIEAALTSPNLLGRVRLATVPGMNQLRTLINRTLTKMIKSGEIDSYSFELPGEEIVRKTLSERTPEEIATLAAMVAARQFEAVISIIYTGAVHSLDPVSITYSGS